MSVSGEFERILGDTTAALRVRGEAELSERLERLAAGPRDALTVRADAVLAELRAIGDAELQSAVEHLNAICRVIVGR